jgi:hypothetical protein
MFTRKTMLASALIAPALAISTPASAASSFAGLGSSTIINGNGAFFDAAIPAGTFNDRIEFDVNSSGIADVGILYFEFVTGISNLTATFNGAPINFTKVTSDLYSGGIKTSIVPGTQIITVGGTSNGPTSSYSGTLKFSAVPEAGTWLMMIAGIGFAGFALRRRGTETKVSYAF